MKSFTKVILLTLCSTIISFSMQAQGRGVKPKPKPIAKPVKISYPKKTNLAFSAGFTQSVLFLARNVKENNNAKGYSFAMVYGGSKIFRISMEYTYYSPISIQPTWYNINAGTIEANAHIIARVKDSKSVFYPMFGLSYNHFSGFFTGRNDFLNLSEKYKVNAHITTNWLGLNIGTGYEKYIGPFSFFVEYKMRIGVKDGAEHHLNIMDVCIGFGLRYNIKVPSVYKIINGTRNRYFLD